MPDPKNRSTLLKSLRFASIATENVEVLRQAIEGLGGSLVQCQAFSAADNLECQRLMRQSVSRFANQLLVGELDMMVFVTSAGVNYFLQHSSRLVDRRRLIDSLSDIVTVAGTPLAAGALQQIGLQPTIELKQPQSWRDVLIAIDQRFRVANFQVGLEESQAIHGLAAGIEARGGRVWPLAVYPQVMPSALQPGLEFLEMLKQAQCHAILFTGPGEVQRFGLLVKQLDGPRWLNRLSDDVSVMSLGTSTKELLDDYQIPVDHVSQAADIPGFVEEVATLMKEMEDQKASVRANFANPAAGGLNRNAPWYFSPFMKACRGEPTEVTPIWLMRQAGRYMQEYRAVREKTDFLTLCSNPQLCSEVMCTAVNKLGVDAAILFSDLLPMLVPMGMDLEFAKGDGPAIHNPIRDAQDLKRVRRLEDNSELMFVMEAVEQTRRDLPDDIPLIGFAGAPFTLASYMIEGGASRNYAHTKRLMYGDQGAWHELMQHLAHSITVYLTGQIAAGAQAVQLFDSWAGCLAFEDYHQFVHPYVQQIINRLPRHVPVINFATGNPCLLPLLADTRAAVIGIDWRIRLDQAWALVGNARSVQGNLDPVALLTNPREIRRQAKSILDQAEGRAGHIFNLGHGILPQTPVDHVIALVEAVHELSSR
jgi:uroporphyrinogen decarboxylase